MPPYLSSAPTSSIVFRNNSPAAFPASQSACAFASTAKRNWIALKQHEPDQRASQYQDPRGFRLSFCVSFWPIWAAASDSHDVNY